MKKVKVYKGELATEIYECELKNYKANGWSDKQEPKIKDFKTTEVKTNGN